MNDAIIIGGGFYGTSIAIFLAKSKYFKNIILIEKEKNIHLRASLNNQARVHMGYHYPRSFTTAFRSKFNLPKFLNEWDECIEKDYIHLYAISKLNSKTTSKQYEKFCRKIGIHLSEKKGYLTDLFNPRLIEKVYAAEEYVFNIKKIIKKTKKSLKKNKIKLFLETEVKSITKKHKNKVQIKIKRKDNTFEKLNSKYIFNCTYSEINQFFNIKTPLKHELTEVALVKVPKELKNLGITIMDGPFFSLMPFPSKNLHSLTHVRYTPHTSWTNDNYKKINIKYQKQTKINRMIRDSKRYLPIIEKSDYLESFYEIKTVSMNNENDDGRPIIFEKNDINPKIFTILGGKIDNIYDIFSKLEEEIFS
tara:strand:- start:4276 stop:5364 length:1089 start_codon:yes stop_codon:yes gene_type:complete